MSATLSLSNIFASSCVTNSSEFFLISSLFCEAFFIKSSFVASSFNVADINSDFLKISATSVLSSSKASSSYMFATTSTSVLRLLFKTSRLASDSCNFVIKESILSATKVFTSSLLSLESSVSSFMLNITELTSSRNFLLLISTSLLNC